MPSVHFVPPSTDISRPFSIALPNSKPQTISLTSSQHLNPKKRPHSTLADSDSENEAATHNAQLISSFDHSAGGAISINGAEKAKAPLIIQVQKNRDWREESRRKRGKNLLPAEVQAGGSDKDSNVGSVVEKQDVPQEFGLTFVAKESKDQDGDVSMLEVSVASRQVTLQEAPKVKTADEEAMDALMGDGSKTSTLTVLPITSKLESDTSIRTGAAEFPLDENALFRSDVASRPDPASLEDYAAVPVEEFGAALLRGMGWKEGDVISRRKDQISKPRLVERRPALLGIGAKEVPGGAVEELGAWGKITRGKKGRVENTYTPVLLRDKKTGEMLTEEELEDRKKQQIKDMDAWKERRDREIVTDQERQTDRKRQERDGGKYSSRSKGSRSAERSRHRDRSRSAERQYVTSRRRDWEHDEYEHERRNRRENEYRQKEKRLRYSTSPRRSGYGDKDRDRDRDRDRDARRRENVEMGIKVSSSASSRHGYRDREGYQDSRRRHREEVF